MALDSSRRIVIASILTCIAYLFFFQIFPNFRNPNETSRFFLTSAIVEDHAVNIDGAMKRYGDTKDKSIYNGHFYAAKPIGYSIFAVPFYFAFAKITELRDAAVAMWFLRIFVNLIPLLMFSVFFFRYMKEKLQLGDKAFLLIIAFLFGTLFFPFAQTFISHVTTGILWFVAFYLIIEKQDSRSAFLSGAILGLCFIMEVLSLIEIGVLGLFLLWKGRNRLFAFCTGAVLFAIPAFIYNAVVFGGPLQWPYLHTYYPGFQAQNKVGYVGARLPSLVVLLQLLFGTYRGFFYYMPHLFFGLIGLIREKEKRAASLAALGIVAGNFLFNSGMLAWDGGWCFGPRYIIPVIPFLIYGSALWYRQQKSPTIYLVLLAWTIPIMFFGTSTFLYSPGATYNPILWENFTLFWRGLLASNVGKLLEWNIHVIQLVAIAFVAIPTLMFVGRAGLAQKQFRVFAIVFLLMFPFSLLLQRSIEPMTPARDLFIIGICAHFQGNETAAEDWLSRANEKNRDPAIRQAIAAYLAEIHAVK